MVNHGFKRSFWLNHQPSTISLAVEGQGWSYKHHQPFVGVVIPYYLTINSQSLNPYKPCGSTINSQSLNPHEPPKKILWIYPSNHPCNHPRRNFHGDPPGRSLSSASRTATVRPQAQLGLVVNPVSLEPVVDLMESLGELEQFFQFWEGLQLVNEHRGIID